MLGRPGQNVVVLFVDPGETLLEQAMELLAKVSGLKVETVDAGPVLAERYELPFLETANRERYYGIRGIKQFVAHVLAA